MKIDNKLILEHSKNLNVLYVEDDDSLRNATKKIFSNYFKEVDTAVDGQEGWDKYLLFKENNDAYYDLVISDINMPRMNGIDMSIKIVDENPEQAIIFITAHDEASFLHSAIQIGVNGFLNKPIDQEQLKLLLYKTTQSISDHKSVDVFYKQVEELNTKLHEQNDEIAKEKEKLEEQVRLLKIQANATNTKHKQVEQLLKRQSPQILEPAISEYFSKDDDEGDENVLLLNDDCDEMSEILNEMPELLMQYSIEHDRSIFDEMTHALTKISSILLHYTPFLDPLAESFGELSNTIKNHTDEFIKIFEENPDNMMMLYDSISLDMDRYMNRFSVESMAMKNIHHIHHPTTLSIQQIIGIILPDEVEEGDMEFF